MSGFTLVELMLAMAFISFLLLAIAGVVIQISGMYDKGVTLKAVNQVGRTVVADMKQTVGNNSAFNTASAFVTQTNKDANGVAHILGGRFCTGTYSYIWNIGSQMTIDSNGQATTQENQYAGDSATPVRLVKVRDNGGMYCALNANGTYPNIQKSDATELFASQNQLTVQCFQINAASCNSDGSGGTASLTNLTASGSALYMLSIVISDANQDAIDTSSNGCKPPAVDSADQNYCAVNEFDFMVRAGIGGGQ